ncbi:MAG TPA: PHP domain-containing protein [Longimicrobiales bacterium]
MKLDLHLHSTASDGSLSPSALMWAARAGGLDVVALTDHDTCAGIAEALASLPPNLHLVPGIELSTTLDGVELHILGYFIDYQNAALSAHAGEAAERRAERVRKMVACLARYSIHITYDEVVAEAGETRGVLARPHVARVMLRKGYVQTIAEAFDRFIGDAGPCFLPTELLHPRAAIELIAGAGGVAMWAHPRPDQFERLIAELTDWGLRGVECIRPRLQPSEIQFFEESARTRDLLISGGSDWHGTWHGRLGDFFIRADEVAELLDVGGL